VFIKTLSGNALTCHIIYFFSSTVSYVTSVFCFSRFSLIKLVRSLYTFVVVSQETFVYVLPSVMLQETIYIVSSICVLSDFHVVSFFLLCFFRL
jgi:hypothetical protein